MDLHNEAYIIGLVIGIVLAVIIVFLIPFIFYLLTLQNTFKLIQEHNRSMAPGQVWLMLIPLFGMVWHFIVVERLADSIKKELLEKNHPLSEERPAYNIGLTTCILNCCAVIPFIGGLFSIAGFVCWIIYWVKIYDYKKKLESLQTAPAV